MAKSAPTLKAICIAIVKLNDVSRHAILLVSVEFLARIYCRAYPISDLVNFTMV